MRSHYRDLRICIILRNISATMFWFFLVIYYYILCFYLPEDGHMSGRNLSEVYPSIYSWHYSPFRALASLKICPIFRSSAPPSRT